VQHGGAGAIAGYSPATIRPSRHNEAAPATRYKFPDKLDGTGQTIAIIEAKYTAKLAPGTTAPATSMSSITSPSAESAVVGAHGDRQCLLRSAALSDEPFGGRGAIFKRFTPDAEHVLRDRGTLGDVVDSDLQAFFHEIKTKMPNVSAISRVILSAITTQLDKTWRAALLPGAGQMLPSPSASRRVRQLEKKHATVWGEEDLSNGPHTWG
jgi:hypothetical protein